MDYSLKNEAPPSGEAENMGHEHMPNRSDKSPESNSNNKITVVNSQDCIISKLPDSSSTVEEIFNVVPVRDCESLITERDTHVDEGDKETSDTSCELSHNGVGGSDLSSVTSELVSAPRTHVLMEPGSVRAPIIGHETIESRSKFTVFRIHVTVEANDTGWFIFRRYSDFVHLNDQLKPIFPHFRLSLPPKRWFRNNFDSEFLEERLLGLQAFVNNVTGHKDVCNSRPVRNFFCFDDPPGPHDSLEESQAQCECMEDTIYLLRRELSEKDRELNLLKEEIELYKNQVQLLTNRLSTLNKRSSLERSGTEKNSSSVGNRQQSGTEKNSSSVGNRQQSGTEKNSSSVGNRQQSGTEKNSSSVGNRQQTADILLRSGDKKKEKKI